MKKISPVIVVVILVLVVAFGIGQFFAIPARAPAVPASSSTSVPEPPATQVVTYMPAATASSTPVAQGSCWTSSIAAPFRSDAWRCSVGNSVNDPCFEIPGSKDLLCGADPARPNATSSFVLALTQPLPAPETIGGPVPANWAWLLQLADGTVCSPFTGTLPVVEGGVSANYGCAPKTPGGEGLLLFGDLNASTSEWTAEAGTIVASGSGLPVIANEETVPVAAVWQ